ncbi:hypothetical protein [Saccharopolyspora elongata]|uniref:hypothetical protein n=1 Tax=Saccharopolyspora elongata TaxID=2530387 RepID=UPI0014042779|nr:hypothetical protein [Saccharopolyspora elongata]
MWPYTRVRLVLRERLTEPGEDAPYGRNAVRTLTWAVGRFREIADLTGAETRR